MWLFILLVSVTSNAVAESLGGTIVTVVIASGSTVDARVEQILTDSAVLFLTQQGAQASTTDYALSDAEPSRRDIIRVARRDGSGFVLVGTYNPADDGENTLVLGFSLYLTDPVIPIAATRGPATVNLSLDRTVADLLGTLLNEAFAYLADTNTELPGAGAPSPDEQPGASTAPGEPAIRGTADGTVFAGPDTLEFAFSYAPSLAVADAAQYYTFGHGAAVAGEWIFGTRNTLGAGIAASAVFADASGTATGGALLIVPIGATVSLRSAPTPIGAYVTTGGGGAVIHITNAFLGSFTKVVPYATLGIGVRLALLNWAGLSAGIKTDVIFEGSVLITSFVPSISLTMGF